MTPTSPLEPLANEPEHRPEGWVVIVPVKPATVGKSRLADAAVDRAALARAIALDTIAAAAGATRVARVVVVTDDEELIRAASGLPRITTVPETEAAGLDAAAAPRAHPGPLSWATSRHCARPTSTRRWRRPGRWSAGSSPTPRAPDRRS